MSMLANSPSGAAQSPLFQETSTGKFFRGRLIQKLTSTQQAISLLSLMKHRLKKDPCQALCRLHLVMGKPMEVEAVEEEKTRAPDKRTASSEYLGQL
jgi:hypothetical protein